LHIGKIEGKRREKSGIFRFYATTLGAAQINGKPLNVVSSSYKGREKRQKGRREDR
jgi:hypothetical protein